MLRELRVESGGGVFRMESRLRGGILLLILLRISLSKSWEMVDKREIGR